MVVFTCNHCGDSLQKPRVEKHYNIQCRRPKSLTCVDCFKDFKDEEYAVHIKCITEEERYAAKGSIPGGVVKKGDVKQESWTDMIKSIVDNEENLKPSLRSLFHVISNYTNVPRKKNKFLNFLKNSLGSRVIFKDVESAWDLIEKYKKSQSKSNESSTNNNHEQATVTKSEKKHKIDRNSDEVPAKKKKKEIIEDECNSIQNGHSNDGIIKKKKKKESKINNEPIEEAKEIDVFSYKNTILNILKEKGSISVNKLQKKVLNAYTKQTGNESTEKTVKKYNQKLKKLANVVVNDDTVTFENSDIKN